MSADPCAMPTGYGETCQLPGDHPHGCQQPLPPYSRSPLTTEDGLEVVGWWGSGMATTARCKCSHSKSNHSTRTGDCWSAACGCASYRPQETT